MVLYLSCLETDVHLGVAQLVARYLGVVEAAGSSPVTQTIKSRYTSVYLLFIICATILDPVVAHKTSPCSGLGVVGELRLEKQFGKLFFRSSLP